VLVGAVLLEPLAGFLFVIGDGVALRRESLDQRDHLFGVTRTEGLGRRDRRDKAEQKDESETARHYMHSCCIRVCAWAWACDCKTEPPVWATCAATMPPRPPNPPTMPSAPPSIAAFV